MISPRTRDSLIDWHMIGTPLRQVINNSQPTEGQTNLDFFLTLVATLDNQRLRPSSPSVQIERKCSCPNIPQQICCVKIMNMEWPHFSRLTQDENFQIALGNWRRKLERCPGCMETCNIHKHVSFRHNTSSVVYWGDQELNILLPFRADVEGWTYEMSSVITKHQSDGEDVYQCIDQLPYNQIWHHGHIFMMTFTRIEVFIPKPLPEMESEIIL